MITGIVNADLDATLRLTIVGLHGKRRIRAIIDTGFDGFLSLPPDVIAELGLNWNGKSQAELADGSTSSFDTFTGIVVWDRRRTHILIDEANTTPLVGTALLWGYHLSVTFRRGEVVTLRAMPRH